MKEAFYINSIRVLFSYAIFLYFPVQPLFAGLLEPTIAYDATGDILIIWEEADPITNNEAVFSNEIPSGGSFSGASQFSQAGQHSTSPTVAFDSLGNAVSLWISQDPTSRNYLLYASKKALLGTFSAPVLISSALDNVDFDFNFIFRDSGLLRVVWSSTLDGKTYTSNTTFGAWSWSTPLLISN